MSIFTKLLETVVYIVFSLIIIGLSVIILGLLALGILNIYGLLF